MCIRQKKCVSHKKNHTHRQKVKETKENRKAKETKEEQQKESAC